MVLFTIVLLCQPLRADNAFKSNVELPRVAVQNNLERFVNVKNVNE